MNTSQNTHRVQLFARRLNQLQQKSGETDRSKFCRKLWVENEIDIFYNATVCFAQQKDNYLIESALLFDTAYPPINLQNNLYKQLTTILDSITLQL